MEPRGVTIEAARTRRHPCVPIAVALAVGIAGDHLLPMRRETVFLAAFVLLIGLVIFRRSRRLVRVTLLTGVFVLLGAAGHGAAWRDRGPDSILRRIGETPRLASVRGVAVSAPRIDRRRESGRSAAWPLVDRTRIVVELESIFHDAEGRFVPVSGRVQLASAGHLVHLAAGDRFETTGWISFPPRPKNPGDFDVRDYFRKQRLDGVLTVDHPDAVRRTSSPGWSWQRAVHGLRHRLGVQFADRMSEANGPVAAAMILGDRSTMPLDVRDAYVASGAMHILAISGVNVGILAVFLLAIGRLLGVSSLVANLVVVACVWSYALLTDLESPVVRAAVFLSIWAAATHLLRRSSLLSTVAATATVLLLVDPLLLFDAGARLSFLAVLGMAWALRAMPLTEGLRSSTASHRSSPRHWLRLATAAQGMGVGVWLFTAPAIATDFGIVSPVGLLLNVLLVPLTAVVMWSGYAFFGMCLIAPDLSGPFGSLFDLGLSLTNAVVVPAGQWRFGHAAVPPPPAWWLAGYYAVLLASLAVPPAAGRRLRRWSALLGWTAIGLLASIVPARENDAIQVTVLDVGHGGATLVESSDGRLLLYDCGSMTDDRRAAETVWRTVLARGCTHLDAVVLSHADLDHCNNVPALLREGSVGAIVVSRSFLDFEQPAVVEVCEAARRAGVPIRLVDAGSSLRFDDAVSIDVLHPADRRPDGDDNANSIVLRVQFGERRLLLTGDLEGSGQSELFARHPPETCDVLFAPHHGGRGANTAELASWADPRVVVASAGRRLNVDELAAVYPEARLYATPTYGAIVMAIHRDGRLAVDTFRDDVP